MTKLSDKLEFEVFDLHQFTYRDGSKKRSLPMTLHIDQNAKEKYDALQSQTRHQFGKYLKRLVEEAINAIDIENPPKSA